jgi:hypothetical protein
MPGSRTTVIAIAIALLTGYALHAQFPATGASRSNLAPRVRGFSVVLVQGDMRPGAPIGDQVPVGARKALSDAKNSLSYKTYRLLDTQWTIGAGTMTGRLRGTDNTTYEFELTARTGFTLIPGEPFTPEDQVHVSTFVLRDSTNATVTDPTSSPRNDSARRALPDSHTLIDRSFNMMVGETVVAGTSGLQGDAALIVLLTAVSRPDDPFREGR